MKLARLFTALAALVLGGCIEITQEVWINGDGSGRMTMDLGLSEQLLSMAGSGGEDPLAKFREQAKKTKAELQKDPNVSSVAITERKEGGDQHFVYDVQVKDVTRLRDVESRLSSSGPLGEDGKVRDKGEFKIEKQPNGRLLFLMRLQTPKQDGKGGKQADALARGMAAAMFGNRAVTIRLHAPKIADTNGTLDDQKTTVEWRIPLVDLISEKAGRELRAEVEMPSGVPWLWIALAGGAIGIGCLLVTVAVVVMLMRRKKET